MASEVGGLGNLAAERAAAENVRRREAKAEEPQAAPAAPQAEEPKDGVKLSDKAQDELATQKREETPQEKDAAPKEEAKRKDEAAEELKAELARPKEEQDEEKIKKLRGEVEAEGAEEGKKGEPKVLEGEVHGRPIDPKDPNDMFWSWLQKTGRPAPRNEKEAREAYKDLAGYAEEYGFKVDVVEHKRLDKIIITNPDGKRVQADVVGNMGGAFGDQRWWFGDEHEPKPGVKTTPAGDHQVTGPEGPGFEPLKGQIFGRDAHPGDAHDMFWVWQQQSGRPAPRNSEEAREAYKDLAAFAEKHGFKVDVVEHQRLDKIVITTPDGRQVKADVVANMGGNFGDQRWWFGDITNPEPKAAAPAAGGGAAPGLGNAPLEGFDWAKLMNPNHVTPKYQFGRVASHFDLSGVRNQQDAEALLESMIQALQAQGLYVVGVDGDKIQVRTELGFEWVDVIRGAGSGNPAFQWLSTGRGTPYPTVFPPA